MNLDDLRKLEHGSRRRKSSLPAESEVQAIVKVRKPSYVPKGVKVRSRIDDTMFTASCRADALAGLERDPNVESVALSQPLGRVDDE